MKTLSNIFVLSFLLALVLSCGSKGLDHKDNKKEKERHENFRDSTDQDSTTGSVNVRPGDVYSAYIKPYYRYLG